MPPKRAIFRFLLLAGLTAAAAEAQTGQQVLLIVNQNDAASREIAGYYRPRRSVPVENVCSIRTVPDEEISWDVYVNQIEKPVGECLKGRRLTEKILYLVTTLGVPLKVTGNGKGKLREEASVDSELTLLYAKLQGKTFQRTGGLRNPFFMQRDEPFTHTRFPMYLVTRLAAYSVAEVKAAIDRSLAARLAGRFVLDLSSEGNAGGNNWLRTAAMLLPKDRVVLDESTRVLYGLPGVIGYASWGSNDGNRKRRMLGFHWLPGAIATEYVSTDARTFVRPPDTFVPGGDWSGPNSWHGSPQGLTADFIHEGATGASGHVYEPYLGFCPRPDYLLPAYYQGRNLAESYWLAIPALSWMNVVVGDPLCQIRSQNSKVKGQESKAIR